MDVRVLMEQCIIEPVISNSDPLRSRDPDFLANATDFLIRSKLPSKSRANWLRLHVDTLHNICDPNVLLSVRLSIALR